MSELTAIEQLEELQSDIEETAGAIYHAIDSVVRSSGGNIDELENEIEEARQYAEDMKRKMRKLITLLEYVRETAGEGE